MASSARSRRRSRSATAAPPARTARASTNRCSTLRGWRSSTRRLRRALLHVGRGSHDLGRGQRSQDLALVSLIGLTHVERNGHHFIDGMSFAPEDEQRSFVAAHPDLYDKAGSGHARLHISNGRLRLGSLAGAGFAVDGEMDFASMRPMPAASRGASFRPAKRRPHSRLGRLPPHGQQPVAGLIRPNCRCAAAPGREARNPWRSYHAIHASIPRLSALPSTTAQCVIPFRVPQTFRRYLAAHPAHARFPACY